jgi:hypothetical protein
MQDTKIKPPDHFFSRGGKWRTISFGLVAGSSILLAPINLWSGDIRRIILAYLHFGLAVTCGWQCWHGWGTWKHPLVTVSDEAIEWGEASPQHRERVLLQDVLELIPPVGPSATPVGLRTRSRGTVWSNVAGLSLDNRRKVCSAIATRLPAPPANS